VVCSSTPLAAEAQANNTLEWGVVVGEEFTYVMQRAYFADQNYALLGVSLLPFISNMTIGERAILRITELDEIPTQINETIQMPQSLCNLERANDSVSNTTNLVRFVIPIGDWEFIDEMINVTNLPVVTPIDTVNEWGSTGTGLFEADDGSIITITVDIRYEKENGTLNYMRYHYTTLGTDLLDIIIVNWHQGMPTIVAGDVQIPTILIISIAGVVGIIVFIIVYQGYRSKKSIVQKLGE